MITPRLLPSFLRTPALAGVLFCHLFTLASCKESGTPDWSASERPAETPQEFVEAKEDDAAPRSDTDDPNPPQSSTGGFRFIAYNVENWLLMDRRVENQNLKNAPKPEAERAAAITLMVAEKPDVLGLCEIGTREDLQEVQTRLKTAGLDLPHLLYTGGTDEVRHLGLLSKYPITSTAKPAETNFKMRGTTYGINRGILDATVTIRSTPYRFLGVHLKSKRQVEGFDQEEMRIHEAKLLRRHIDSILGNDAKARLIVYGDFNDTRPTHTIRSVTGGYTEAGYLTAIPFKDKAGTAWTHHWKPHDIYSRIDFVFVSRELRRQVDFKASHIADAPAWELASDHRPLVANFR